MAHSPVRPGEDGIRCELTCPTAMPKASAYLWNPRLLVQANCRGFVDARHMQPEPGRYAYAPNLEARTFIQPEQPQYAHQPGRFVYVRDDDSGELFSAPHEPVRREPESFLFSAGPGDIRWQVANLDLRLDMTLALPPEDALELWTVTIANPGPRPRRLSVYPYFTIGYMSWMNQSARYREDLGGIVASCVTPYQKLEEWPVVKTLKDRTFFLHDTRPDHWEAARETFEGEGGLHAPDGVRTDGLGDGDAVYETPAAVLQYRLKLAPGERREFRFLFGPARDDDQIRALRKRYLSRGAFAATAEARSREPQRGDGCLQVDGPDGDLNRFTNHWLPRQVRYQGQTQRLATDPQTRNYLQDAMGMTWIDPGAARDAFRHALSQQRPDGGMPDGILVVEGAELKYINQVPHTDHPVWVPVCLEAWLDETGDEALLEEAVVGNDGRSASVRERIGAAMHWLIANRDERGLSLIAQGDWCDPMNMVGPAGRGVSGWLSMATVHALRTWAGICERAGHADEVTSLRQAADDIAAAVQQHLWDGDWFARGITDGGRRFGVAGDDEGRIFLNPQSWALLAGIADDDQRRRIVAAVETHLETPHGVTMLGPPYTHMVEDIGRLTQKHPGVAENGSVYNHAAAFYIRALYGAGEHERAFRLLRRMLPGPDAADLLQRGQLPVFVPNYYRGAHALHPRTAGRSSQLINTGTAGWLYRILIEDLFGLRGCAAGLRVEPRLPGAWDRARASRRFRGARFEVNYHRVPGSDRTRVWVDDLERESNIIGDIEAGREYIVDVRLPAS